MEKGTSWETLKLYWRFNRPHRKYMLGNLLIFPITILLSVQISSYVVSIVVDRLSDGTLTSFDDFLPYLTILILVGITNIVLTRLNIFLLWRHEDYTARDISVACFDNLNQQSAAFYADRFGGSLVGQTGKFTYGYVRLYDTIMFNLYTLIWAIIFSTVLLWLRVPAIAILIVVFSMLYAWLVVAKYRKQIPLNVRMAKAENKRTGYLADGITNIMTIKAFGRENYELVEFGKYADKARDRGQDIMWSVQKKEFLLSPINVATGILAVAIAVLSVVKWGQPVGTVVLVLYLSTDILRRVWDLNNVMRQLNHTFGDAHEMTEIFLSQPEVQDQPNATRMVVDKGQIRFDKVSFHYADNKGEHLFRELSLDIAGGERIGLVGPSGGGKTTITKLLLRFMDVESGSISIDDQDIVEVKQQDLRKHIAYVPQEPLLFHRTLSENIKYGKPDATQTEVEEAAKLANAHEFIAKLPHGYETKVGERGVKLSGGQRQRVAIARAILKNSPIIILDEATSSLDSSSELLIQEALWRLMKGRTAVVIAHRLSTVQRMDRIVVLDEGKILEEGSHEELLNKRGLYYELWQHQSGGFIK